MGFHSKHHRTSDGARIDVDQRAANCILALRSRSSASERPSGRRGLHVVCRSGRRTFQEALPSIESVQLTPVLMEIGDIDATREHGDSRIVGESRPLGASLNPRRVQVK